MYRVYNGQVEGVGGTSNIGNVIVPPASLVAAFGKPGESDEHKVSGEWTFIHQATETVFTLYDWKATSLYDDSLITPEEFWANTVPRHINIGGVVGGKVGVEQFKRDILNHIRWIKVDKPFEQAVLGYKEPISELFIVESTKS